MDDLEHYMQRMGELGIENQALRKAIERMAFQHHDDYEACSVCMRTLDTFCKPHPWTPFDNDRLL